MATALLPKLAEASAEVESIPEAIAAIRKHFGWSRRELARQMGVWENNVKVWENGTEPSAFCAIWLLKAYQEIKSGSH
jgi:DNA-binding transcriptional regulator YiaG